MDIIKPSDLGYTQYHPIHDILNASFVPANSALTGVFIEDHNILNAVFVEGSNALNIKIAGGSVSGDTTFNGNVSITGNLNVSGTTIQTDVEVITLLVDDNWIILNNGETGSGVSEGEAGFEIDRGALVSAVLFWDETTDTWQAGVSGSTITLGEGNWSRVGTITELKNSGDDVRIQSLTGATERMVTVGDGVLSASTEIEDSYISDATVISNIISVDNWTGKTYGGSLTDLEAGQKYIGSNYVYEYDGTTVARYKRFENLITDVTYPDLTYTVLNSDDVILLDASTSAVTATLTSSVEVGKIFNVKAVDVTNTTILDAGSGTIDGETGFTYSTQYDNLTIVHDGAGVYYIV